MQSVGGITSTVLEDGIGGRVGLTFLVGLGCALVVFAAGSSCVLLVLGVADDLVGLTVGGLLLFSVDAAGVTGRGSLTGFVG